MSSGPGHFDDPVGSDHGSRRQDHPLTGSALGSLGGPSDGVNHGGTGDRFRSQEILSKSRRLRPASHCLSEVIARQYRAS